MDILHRLKAIKTSNTLANLLVAAFISLHSFHSNPNATMITSIIFIPINGNINPPKPYISKFRFKIVSAPTGLYSTPFNAKGIKATNN